VVVLNPSRGGGAGAAIEAGTGIGTAQGVPARVHFFGLVPAFRGVGLTGAGAGFCGGGGAL
jgi:hypothetical protein